MLADMKAGTKAKAFDLKDVAVLGGPFKHAMDLNKEYLLQLEPDRLLARFREYAGFEVKAPQYEGWEAMSLSGHTLGHYLSACSMLYASLEDIRFKERVDYIVDELEICQNGHGDGYVSGIPRGREIFLEVASGDIRSKGFDLNGGWAPLYTIHKLLAGLRDALRLAGNVKALQVAVKLADWLDGIFAKLTDNQMEEMMICEFGGMNEVLADLYADTGEVKYLRLAERFWHKLVLDPLAAHEDCLPGKHANTQIPKLIGLAREYELTNDVKRKLTAEFFWDRVVHHHSYAIGGNSFGEYFGEPDTLNDRLGPHTTETCNTYNMLKLTRHLFQWNGSAKEADYYERALFNHILASQDPVEGGVTYCLSLAMGGYKDYNDKFEHFTCCVGTGMENHASYGSSIYFHSDEKLYVNQYIPSSLNWKEKGVTLVQQTDYPEDDRIAIQISCKEPVNYTMCIRYPFWAEKGIEVKVNGEAQQIETEPGSFVEIARRWIDGDQVEVTIPMTLRLESMPDNPSRAAVLYGPLVLAGELGPLNDPDAFNFLYTPVLIPNHKALTEWLQPVEGKTNTFRTVEAGYPREVELYPFYRMHDKLYSVYWDLFTEEEWGKTENEYLIARKKISILEQCTVDYAQPGEMQPERDHNFQGDVTRVGLLNNRAYRNAGLDGWFSYDLKVRPETAMMLVITYTAAQEMPACEFDILVDGKPLTDVQEGFSEMERFYNVNYVLPEESIKGNEIVTVTFQAHPGHRVRRVFGLRLVSREQYIQFGVNGL
ncbi:glycoside hydrolase family 127 protein [Paenibacillus alkaliterrae]|uniref:glycoside hydrolase family 127 protein n=1 Tax=Paenibacillus alkaliterrae TaxID=320909 RepID=UPI001F381967|nr:glycoside hydrolase family 127 protein [Paenibacillus alkaliterrae]MCF2938549.1 glycoside hydrolase family 127 protein [Paenibacillus alkaliterrae]